MAKLIDLGSGLRFNAFYPRTFRDDDDAEAPGFHPLLYMAYDTVERHGLFAATRYLKSSLYEVSPTDPATFAAVVAVLFGVAALAQVVPAARATRIDPAAALRHD